MENENVELKVVVHPIAVKVDVACTLIGCKPTKLREYVTAGRLRVVRHGKAVAYLVSDLHFLAEELTTYEGGVI